MSKRYVLLLVVREKNGMARLDRGQGSNGWSSRPQGGILFRNHTPSRRRDLRGSERTRERRKKREREETVQSISVWQAKERRNDVPERSKASRKIVFDDSLILARAVIIRENSLTDAPVRGVLRVSLFFTVTLKPGRREGDRPKISLSSFSRS